MNEKASSLQPEELLAHVEWVRRLARSLVAGDDRADDVAQETWLHALRAPPADRTNVRGWLTRVAQNVARKLARGEERRERRESIAPPPAPLPSPEESFERATLQRRVVDAVLSLDELYRAPLLLRFFEELAPADVARSLGVPVETARTRIKRGLELLRARLVGAAGGASDSKAVERALAPLLVWPVASVVGTAGVTVMAGTAWKLAGVAAAVAAVAWLGIEALGSKEMPRGAPAVAKGPAPAAVDGASADQGVPADRATDSSATPATRTSGRVLLHGFVVDDGGEPIQGATIHWNEMGGAPATDGNGNRVDAEQGEYAIANLPPRVVNFRVESIGCVPRDVALDLTTSDGVTRHDFVLGRMAMIAVRLAEPDGRPLDPASVPGDFARALAVVATEQTLPARLTPTTSANFAGHGFGRFHENRRDDPVLRKSTSPVPADAYGVFESPQLPFEMSLLVKHLVIAHQTVTRRDETVVFTVDRAAISKWLGKLALRCVDAETKEPLAEVAVQIGDSSSVRTGKSTGTDGHFESWSMAPGWMQLGLRGSGHAMVQRYVLVEPGATTDLGTIELDRAITLDVHVVDTAGRPVLADLIAGRLDGHRPGEPFGSSMRWRMDEPGHLALPELGRGRTMVAAVTADERAKAALVVEITGPDPAPISLVLQATTPVTIAPNFARDELHEIELVRSDGFIELAGIAGGYDLHERLLPGSYSCSVYDGATPLKQVTFEVGSEPLRVGFSLEDHAAAKVTVALPAAKDGAGALAPGSVRHDSPTALAKKEPSLLVTGSVRDSSGAPVDRATVYTHVADGTLRMAPTRSDGSFALCGLPPGRRALIATGKGLVDGVATVELAAGAPIPAIELVVTRSTSVAVHLVDPKGVPLEQALDRRSDSTLSFNELRVVATSVAPGPSLSAETLGVSRFQRGWSDDGTIFELDVDAPLPVFVNVLFEAQVLATQELTQPTSKLTITVDLDRVTSATGTVTFRLIDAKSNRPIVRAFTKVMARNGVAIGKLVDLPPEADGLWTLADVPAGQQSLCVMLQSASNPFSLPVEVVADEVTDLGDFTVVVGATLRGFAVDEQGAPLMTRLRLRQCDAAGRVVTDGRFSNIVTTDAKGRFAVQVGWPRVELTLLGDEYASDPLLVDTLTAAGNELGLVARRGIVVTLRAPVKAGAARRAVIVRSDGAELFRCDFRSAAPVPIRLLPGTYRLVIEQDGARPEERSFTVGGEPLEVDLGG